MTLKLELAPLIMNTGITIAYLIKWDEPGKTIYWMGATIIMVGLYIMRG